MTSLDWTKCINVDFSRINPTKADAAYMLKYKHKIRDIRAQRGIVTQDKVDEKRIKINREFAQRCIHSLGDSFLEKTESLMKRTYQSAMFWLQDKHPEAYNPFVQRGLAPDPYNLTLKSS